MQSLLRKILGICLNSKTLGLSGLVRKLSILILFLHTFVFLKGWLWLRVVCFSCNTDLDTRGKIMRVLTAIVKLIMLLGLLYLFICSLDVLSSAFQLVGGENWISAVGHYDSLFHLCTLSCILNKKVPLWCIAYEVLQYWDFGLCVSRQSCWWHLPGQWGVIEPCGWAGDWGISHSDGAKLQHLLFHRGQHGIFWM